MSYKYSKLDNENIKWFLNNNSCQTLAGIKLKSGEIRGLMPFSIEFNYPITAIAGENGSGKSTLLAMAACAFHNQPKAFKLPERKFPYYTYSDFFIQFQGERSPDNLTIKYGIRHDKWKTPGLGWQTRRKNRGGRWTDYSTRVKRQVVYLGTQRIVPPYERSTHRSYRGYFTPAIIDKGTREKIMHAAGRILGKSYDSIERFSASKYSLAKVTIGSTSYSGFNMGAGECSVFDILFAIFAAGKGSLIVIDEIELGLHEQAQRRFINELKEICRSLNCQIICSTHSHAILDVLPPEGRYFIENTASKKTLMIPAVTAEWACGALAGRKTGELDIFVEDNVAENILEISLPISMRKRVNFIPIGSHDAILHVMASRYLEKRLNCMAILDGDRSSCNASNCSKIADYTENLVLKDSVKDWAKKRISYLPGNTWPERFLIQSITESIKKKLTIEWQIDSETIFEKALENAKHSKKHSEFYDLGQLLCLPEDQVRTSVVRQVMLSQETPFKPLTEQIEQVLKDI